MNKEKHLRIRITENQFRELAERIVVEQKTKSELVREMIDDYMKFCRTANKSELIEMNKTIQDLNRNNPSSKF